MTLVSETTVCAVFGVFTPKHDHLKSEYVIDTDSKFYSAK